MASIVQGYEYDIFISYRQKDNKHDGWVTEFVRNLKGELESTFKEEISVYFDISPHDGLLETHDVGASLKEKLRCLIFIPIISQTYCDDKSFAWQYEFTAFNKLAKEDQFGRDIRLAGGNVASRILPVKIHDLDSEDKTLLENELGGVLRSIEFIYKASGVNRPLKLKDERAENLNHTYYPDQINKVANAVKEIITALKKYNHQVEEVTKEVVTTKPEKHKNLKPKIIIGSIFLLALLVLGYFIIPKLSNSSKPVEKSIAVLPFVNDSPDDENTYFINGIMDEVLNNLQKIKDFRVLSRTSTEQYRGSAKPTIPKIAKELGVNYIVEGSGQKYGNTFRLRVQLIAANNEKHLWGESFEQEIKDTKDIFKIQSQVAQAIAAELKETITPEEKQLIEKTSTTNLTAYDFYQRGEEELRKDDNSNNQSLNKAEEFFNKALMYDSTFARAYAGLACVYNMKHGNEYKSYFTENYLDSVLILADRALTFDDHLSDGYFYRALYYMNNGKTEQASKEFDKAIKYNPNYWEAYIQKGNRYFFDINNLDFVKGLEYIHKASRINRGRELPSILYNLGHVYGYGAGFPEEAKKYYQEAFKLDGDTTSYILWIGSLEIQYGDFEKGMEKSLKAYAKDSSNGRLAVQYYFNGQYKESLKYFIKYIENLKSLGQIPEQGYQSMIGYAYLQNGFKKEAEHWFNEQKRLSQGSIKLGRDYSTSSYDLVGVYAVMGEKGKAYEILRMFTRYPIFPFTMVGDIKNNPLYNSIRNEPEFQQILKVMEAKYQAEHERIRKWMEEQEKL
jgi:TolB-like protein/Tfp pilus assembly protein PilF